MILNEIAKKIPRSIAKVNDCVFINAYNELVFDVDTLLEAHRLADLLKANKQVKATSIEDYTIDGYCLVRGVI